MTEVASFEDPGHFSTLRSAGRKGCSGRVRGIPYSAINFTPSPSPQRSERNWTRGLLVISGAAARRLPLPRQVSAGRRRHEQSQGAAVSPQAARKERPFNQPRSSEEPQEIELRRAKEPGRGRRARHPLQIPWAGWKDIFWRAYSEMNSDRLLSISGGVAFFILFAIFPAITALVSAYGIFFNASTIGQDLSLLQGVVPDAVLKILNDQAMHIALQSNRALSIGVIAGILVTLWSAMGGVKAMIDALNVIYEEREQRNLFKLNFVALLFTLGGFAVFLVAVSAVVVMPLVLSWLGLGVDGARLIQLLRWPVLLIVLLAGLAILYRYGPNRRAARWQWVSVGSLFASLVWIGASILFSWYLAKFNTYNATYGSLGAVLAMMMWLWISSMVVLLGAELNAEIEHQTAQDSTIGEDKPLGQRGAVMADTVGVKHE
jgi:membrane protein